VPLTNDYAVNPLRCSFLGTPLQVGDTRQTAPDQTRNTNERFLRFRR